jgi:hypothetical protein
MGKYWRICGCERPNEAFSGRGHRNGICKECSRMPKAEQQRIQDEIFLHHALEQKNISQKNVEYFSQMCLRYSGELGEKAALMVELGKVHPRRKKRYGFLYHKKRELYDRMVRLNLIEEWITDDHEACEEGIGGVLSSRTINAGNEVIFYDGQVRDDDIPF